MDEDDDYGNERSRSTSRRCWECDELAPSGVCARPHPGYDHKSAKLRKHVVEDPTPRCKTPSLVMGTATTFKVCNRWAVYRVTLYGEVSLLCDVHGRQYATEQPWLDLATHAPSKLKVERLVP